MENNLLESNTERSLRAKLEVAHSMLKYSDKEIIIRDGVIKDLKDINKRLTIGLLIAGALCLWMALTR